MGSESNLILALVVASLAPESPHLFNTQFIYHHVSQSDGLTVLGNNIGVIVKVDYQDMLFMGFSWILMFVPKILCMVCVSALAL